MTDPVATELSDQKTLKLHAERLQVERRSYETGSIQVSVATNHHDHLVDQMLTTTDVSVEHVPIGRFVEHVPDIREEGDTVVIPVVEEVVVTRLLLREEVRLTRVSTTRRYQKTVSLRAEEAIVTRTGPDDTERPQTAQEHSHGQ